MPFPVIPVAKAAFVLASAYAVLRKVRAAPFEQEVSDRLDRVAEGIHAGARGPAHLHATARWRRSLRFGRWQRWLEIDAAALARFRVRVVRRAAQ